MDIFKTVSPENLGQVEMRESLDPRVMITQNILTSTYLMQVCAVADATDEEILEVCNTERPIIYNIDAKWQTVYRHEPNEPIGCQEHEGRIHYLVGR